MFGRKYRLHMEEDKYIFQYEGDILPTPQEMSEYIKAFRHSCTTGLTSVDGKVIAMDNQKSGPTRMGF